MAGHRPHRYRHPLRGRLAVLGALLAVLLATAAAAVAWLDRLPAEPATPAAGPPPADAATLARGAALARLANCAGCHTAPGGAALAGARALATPFGTVFAGNLTPDPATGLGHWSADDFWRALHHGRGRDGRRLVPAFPYTSFTHIGRADSDALFAWLCAQTPVAAARPPHALRWPFGSQPALAVWRVLHFRPAEAAAAPAPGPSAERGAWLVRGPGHCAECHAARNALGGRIQPEALRGGLMPMGDWEAPALACLTARPGAEGSGPPDAARSAGLVSLLRTGRHGPDSVAGPMAEVVLASTQYWPEDDLRAVAAHLARLPCPGPAERPAPPSPLSDERRALGQQLYTRHCADCHGARGEGVAGIYPALAGNRSVNLPTALNLVQALRHGGFAPATASHQRPHGMPPQFLNDDEMAAVASWVRQAWGNQGQPLGWLEVSRVPR
ncbi:c-type cytochrome [Aquabacterium sp. OR-4]|uniref:c-type cytochrome n=1 Tax=Aquabacterium sp. OR-4 TaxID=2978127 RepID=UPI0021B365DD|nr:cytochrome c [Aquabacterium sp. OR-4]MDT7838475.1 cytochrome c [Aquabacterium sp. OR-4]